MFAFFSKKKKNRFTERAPWSKTEGKCALWCPVPGGDSAPGRPHTGFGAGPPPGTRGSCFSSLSLRFFTDA